MEKIVACPGTVEDLHGLLVELIENKFNVINVAVNGDKTCIYLEESESKDPTPFVRAWVGRPAPRANDFEAYKRRKDKRDLITHQIVHRYCEFGGGLGDILNGVFLTDQYVNLDSLQLHERAKVCVASHNPFAKELFLWHPKRDRIDLMDVGYWLPGDDEKNRARLGLPTNRHVTLRPNPHPNVTFYPSPEDLPKIHHTKELGKYIVFSTVAGEPFRDIPLSLAEAAINLCIEAGFKVILVGRNYDRFGRKEHRFSPRNGLVDMIDLLTVPGTAALLVGSSGVFCCFSSIAILAWGLRKRTMLLYPPETTKAYIGPISNPWTWGIFFETTVHMEFSDYTPGHLSRWISLLDEKLR